MGRRVERGSQAVSLLRSTLIEPQPDEDPVFEGLLEIADTEELIQMAGEGGTNFRVAPADLRDARIEPTSTLHSMMFLGNKYIGLLCFRHPDRGEMTLEIPTENDMKSALAELPAAFGDGLAVNVMFDKRRWKYVGKPS